MLFSEAIPEKLQENPYVVKLAKVLDGMMVNTDTSLPFMGKITEMGDVDRQFDPVRLEAFNFYQFMLWEIGKINWVYGFPKEIYERLAVNGYNIMALKGSPNGLKLLASSLWLGDVIMDASHLWGVPFLIPDDLDRYGFLPNGSDVANIPDHEDEFLYLYNGDYDYFGGHVEVRMISPYFYMSQFRTFIANVLPKYLAMFDPYNTSYVFKYYGSGFVGAKYMYYADVLSEEVTHTYVKL